MAATDQAGQAAESSAPASTQQVGRRADGRLTLAARLALVVICLAVFLSALDQYVVVGLLNPENSPLMSDLGITLTQLDHASWIVNGYMLGYIVAMPLMGRISDIYGRRRVFVACLAIFALGSVFSGLAPDLGSRLAPDYTTTGGAILSPLYMATQWLLDLLARIGVDNSLPALNVLTGARFVQAIGGGALVPVAIAVVGDLFGVTRRGFALGLVGAVAETGSVLGPLWGAWVAGHWGWQWIFYINVPIALLLLVAGLLVLAPRRVGRSRVDVPGAVLLGAALVCLSVGFGLQSGQLLSLRQASNVTPKPQFLIAAGALLALFVVVELLRRSPAIDVRQFGKRAFSAAALLSFLTGVALVVAIILIPIFISALQSTDEFSSTVVLLRMMIFIPIGAFAGGWLSVRFGCPPIAALGSLCSAVGLYLMSLWPATVGIGQISIATTLAGLGFGLVIAPTSTSALNAAGAGREGMAGSVVTVLRMAGMLLGLSWAFLWAVARSTALFAAAGSALTDQKALEILHQVFGEIFLAAAGIALVGVIPALLLWRRSRAAASPAEPEQSYASYVAPLG